MKLLLMLAVVLAGHDDPASQFGLRCELNAPGTSVHLTNSYSIDLERGVWCGVDVDAGECFEGRTAPIVRADAAEIELLPSEYRNGRRRSPMVINRNTGVLTSDLLTGQCTKVGFTALPEQRF